jgi:hypothetical protein
LQAAIAALAPKVAAAGPAQFALDQRDNVVDRRW